MFIAHFSFHFTIHPWSVKMTMLLLALLFMTISVRASNVTSISDRTIALEEYGVDLGLTFDQLLSPKGIVDQFALSILLQVLFVFGYMVLGKEN